MIKQGPRKVTGVYVEDSDVRRLKRIANALDVGIDKVVRMILKDNRSKKAKQHQ